MLTGHCIDFIGAGLPYLAVLEALRPLRGSPVCIDIPELTRLALDLADLAGACRATVAVRSAVRTTL
jgi:hypothetical protein